MKYIEVVEYDPAWPTLFEKLCDRVSEAVGETAISIEHIGSTAIPGLPAKPVIDMTVVVRAATAVATAIQQLATVGYEHRGDLGVAGREAFRRPPGSPAHHLYVCQEGTPALRNHRGVRDYLRSNAEAAESYGELKKKLAREFPNDIDGYIDGKADFLLNVLSICGMTDPELESIARVNRRGK